MPAAVDGMKVCGDCGVEKPVSEYYKFSHSKDGWTSDCRECRKVRCRGYYARNKEKRAAYGSAYRDANPEKMREKSRREYEANKQAILERHAQWRRENPGYHKDRDSREYAENPERWRRAAARRRARLAGADHEPYERRDIYERDEGICHLCGLPVEWSEFSIDHVIPISQGGPDTPMNVAAAHLTCNLSRGAKPLASIRGGQ